jgi:hypothetical protein
MGQGSVAPDNRNRIVQKFNPTRSTQREQTDATKTWADNRHCGLVATRESATDRSPTQPGGIFDLPSIRRFVDAWMMTLKRKH